VCHLGGTDHAVFNHTGARFNAPAAAEAYLRTFAWFERFVAGRKR
jgi:dienelactone hydrolase